MDMQIRIEETDCEYKDSYLSSCSNLDTSSTHTQKPRSHHHSESLLTLPAFYSLETMPSVVETVQATESVFTPKVKAKLAAHAEKASRDFRSDVVTVPTEDMMNV